MPRRLAPRNDAFSCVRAPAVKAAFLLVVRFPPPAAGAFRFTRCDRARAWGAADRREGLCVQRVDRHVVVGGEGLYRLAGPVEQRAELQQSALVDRDESTHVR